MGMVLVSTNTLPSLAVAAVIVWRLPFTSTRVEVRPNPRRFTLLVPWVSPEVNESGLFSVPELTDSLLVNSPTSTAPELTM